MNIRINQALCLVSFFFCAPYAGAAAEHVAFTQVKSAVNQVLERTRGEDQSLVQDPEKVRRMFEELVAPHFDFEVISRRVLGKAWKTASEVQREDFTMQFRLLLMHTYAQSSLLGGAVQVEYLPLEETRHPNLVVVKTRVSLNGTGTLSVDYRMFEREGQWRAVDIVFDGVSLVSTYRGSFASTVKKDGLDQLLVKLRERNAR